MERDRKLEILKSLSDGIDPYTGEALPVNSPCRHPETVTALLEAIDVLKDAQSIRLRKKSLPENAGRPWTGEEDKQLINNYEAGESFKALSERHKRTAGSIKSRLLKLGKIHF